MGMTIMTLNAGVAIQGGTGGGTQATTQAPPAPTKAQQEELRDAARQLRDAIRTNVDQQVIQARTQDAVRKALQGVSVVRGPTPPGFPVDVDQNEGPVTIKTPDGRTTIIQPSAPMPKDIPPGVEDIAIAFFFTVAAIIIFLPLARAMARRMDRRSAAPQVPAEVSAQLEHLNQAVDAIAVEVERISEGQRFATRLLTEQRDAAPGLTTGSKR